MIKSKTAGFPSVVSRARHRQGVVPARLGTHLVQLGTQVVVVMGCQPSLLSFLLPLSVTPFSISHLYPLPILSEQLRLAWHFQFCNWEGYCQQSQCLVYLLSD